MNNLVIDIGNTRTKFAIFKNNKLVVSFPTSEAVPDVLKELKTDYPEISAVILSSVRDYSNKLIKQIKKEFQTVIELTDKTALPLKNCYETPTTLGKDRIAAAVGANNLYPNQNLLIIDAGTAITYDYVNNNNEYEGGFITPGLNMRFRALHEFTDKLPLLKSHAPLIPEGKNTTSSISGGIQLGIEGEVIRITDHFKEKNTQLKVILTGGDINYFEKLLKNHIFVSPEITLLGLNVILEFSKDKMNK
ncbi:MAG TPA: type III pantothenate kinase [Prolixibacteraceae bacterium]|nr:type III pantothenate kinase [Prolixibacteraceae bacterium]